MEKYYKDGKEYDVEEVNLFGAIVNVNGTSITDFKKMEELTGDSMLYGNGGYTVFCDSDELFFDTFDKAYEFAMNEQKDTFRLEK
jgi:hypothetical protein